MSDVTVGGGRAMAGGGIASWQDFVSLLKPRVMSLVVFTGLAGIVAAPGDLHPVLALTAVLCIALASGGAGAINMWYDRDIDAVMNRTRARALPRGRVSPGDALAFGVFLSVASVLLMGLAVNLMAAVLLATANAFYVFVYTMWLKRRTPQNIVIGGAAGAFPPMIGWAAVTGGVELAPILLFLIIFLWTPPHFWALALYRSGDYAAAGVPMLPVVSGDGETRRQILVYSALLLPAGIAPWLIGAAGMLYGAGSLVLGMLFLAAAVSLWRETEPRAADRRALRLFGFSIFYLFGLFGLLIVERLPVVAG